MSISWQELAAEKKARQAASIPKGWLITAPTDDVSDVTDVPVKCGLLSARELEITTISDLTVLLHKLATREWSSVDVTTAFSKRAIVAHQVVRPSWFLLPIKATVSISIRTVPWSVQTNCLTEIFIDRALERAAWLDEQLNSTGKVVGPLHGLPISLKDQICIEGLETTMGA
jgi:amidase